MEPQPRIKFMSPARREFSSLIDQGVYFLDSFWPGWNNYQNPKSYIIPPIFVYKNPEISDAAFEKYRTKRSRSPIVKDRISDESERFVYEAVRQLIEDEIASPFVAIQNLDLQLNFNKKLHGPLTMIFPNAKWDRFHEMLKSPNAEFDTFILGPKIGIVVIETKSSSFDGERHFEPGYAKMPNDYKKALKQLEKVDALIYLLKECAHFITSKEIPVQKILFTPNLAKMRYMEWIASLSDETRGFVNNRLAGVTQWFREDMVNLTDTDKPPLYSAFRKVIENCAQITTAMYEALTPIISSIASAVVYSSNGTDASVELDPIKISELEASVQESLHLSSHNPFALQRHVGPISKCKEKRAPDKMDGIDKITPWSGLEKSSKQVKKALNVFLLTPEQQMALKSDQPRQFIMGAAGTGKTIVLQAKAIELLSRGQSIIVLTPNSYKWRYKQIFDDCGYTNYKIGNLEEIALKFNEVLQANRLYTQHAFADAGEVHGIIHDFKSRYLKQFLIGFEFLERFDHILIDDAFDETLTHVMAGGIFLMPLLIMALVQQIDPRKIVWAAMDPQKRTGGFFQEYGKGGLDIVFETWKNSTKKLEDDYFSVSLLREVMRCSENIFSAYHPSMRLSEELMPVLGHKNLGCQVVSIRGNYSTSKKAFAVAMREVEIIVERLFANDVAANNLAIIVNDYFLKVKTILSYLNSRNYRASTLHNLAHRRESDTRNVLVVDERRNVSSYEWPIVIFATCSFNSLSSEIIESIQYQKYRAVSRAISMVIVISLNFDVWDGDALV